MKHASRMSQGLKRRHQSGDAVPNRLPSGLITTHHTYITRGDGALEPGQLAASRNGAQEAATDPAGITWGSMKPFPGFTRKVLGPALGSGRAQWLSRARDKLGSCCLGMGL